MFAFHKNETLSRSRQSSVDSPLAECSSLTSAPDAPATSQCSDSVYTEGIHSPERRRRVPSSRRTSVFNIRPRSNTAASTASVVSSSQVDMAYYDQLSPGSPPPLRHVGSQSRLDQSGPRRSIFRGKMGKRLSESIGGTSIDIDDYQEVDAGKKRASFLRKRKGTNESEMSQHDLKCRISSPFDFQHLTHADRHQVAALEQATGSVLVSGWAERASHMSARSPVIQEAASPRNMSTENLGMSELGMTSNAPGPRSPPHSPRFQRDWQQPEVDNGSCPSPLGLRLTRSVESFSQPGVNLRAHRHSSSVVAPSRISSLLPASSFHDIPEEGPSRQTSVLSPLGRSKRHSGVWDAFTLSSVAPADQLPGIKEGSSYVGNAVTTPDDSAIQAMTPPFSPSLEDVAEEPERFSSPRPAPQPPRLRTPTSPRSPFFESFSFNNQRSSGVRTRQRGNSRASPKSSNLRSLAARPSSQTSETLGSPSSTRGSPIPKSPVARRKSNTWHAIEESWEDDVDYIYEHALEADCDNDWDRVSEDEDPTDRHHALARAIREDRPPVPQTARPLRSFGGNKPAFQLQLPFRQPRLPLSNDSVPDLSSVSAVSASTTGTGLQTPFHEPEEFILSPSLLLPRDYKEAQESSYDDILKEYVGSDCHFPIIDMDESATSSARSSRVRFSRRSSYDSSLISSAQSSGLWSSPVQRSASSVGSLPELVHSRRTRRNFSLVVDELSQQVSSLETFASDDDVDDDDDDNTPSGPLCLLADDTYSMPAQDLADNQSHQRNKNTHTQALSDGAAQLLVSAESAKPRGRVATTDGEELMHLFPTPPSFSPSLTE